MNAHALSTPRSFAAELDARQPQLARFGWTMLAITAFCLLAMTLDHRTINGVSVWVKPAKFAFSFVA
jgi:hypothetical protein